VLGADAVMDGRWNKGRRKDRYDGQLTSYGGREKGAMGPGGCMHRTVVAQRFDAVIGNALSAPDVRRIIPPARKPNHPPDELPPPLRSTIARHLAEHKLVHCSF